MNRERSTFNEEYLNPLATESTLDGLSDTVSSTINVNWNIKVGLEELDGDVKGVQPQADSLAVTFATDHYDETSRLLATLDAEHSAIHKGWHFFICDYDDAIQINEKIEFVLTTPNTAKWTHMNLDFASTLGAKLEIYEGSTNVVGGTTVTPVNNNRNSNNTSVLTIVKDPVSITAGTRIAGYLAGANRTSGVQERDRELVLKQNTTYLFRFTSLANSNAISFCWEWYEYESFSNS